MIATIVTAVMYAMVLVKLEMAAVTTVIIVITANLVTAVKLVIQAAMIVTAAKDVTLAASHSSNYYKEET